MNVANDQRVVLVTGAATGVGRACAVRFAARGYHVCVSYPEWDVTEAEETARLVREQGLPALLVPCDVSKSEETVQMASAIEQHWGRLDAIVNCAGMTRFVEHADLDAMLESDWDRIFAVNTKGAFLVLRACLPLLRRAELAAIVNVSSVAGLSGAGSCLAYCASKGALNTLTKSLARALAPRIRVNAVCPGPIDSGWLRQGMTEAQMQQRVASFPIPRLAQPDDIVDAIEYLAFGTSLTTGQLLVVDGGRTM